MFLRKIYQEKINGHIALEIIVCIELDISTLGPNDKFHFKPTLLKIYFHCYLMYKTKNFSESVVVD